MTLTTEQDQSVAEGSAPALRVADLRIVTNDCREILKGVTFEVHPGQLLGLVGESGSGKTTVGLSCLGHLRRGLCHAGGSAFVGAVDVLQIPDDQRRRLRGHRVSYVPQDPAMSLNPAMRIGDQIQEALAVHHWGDSQQARHNRTAEVLTEVDLPNDRQYQKRYPHELSGGQQQRVGIAMAFACLPDVMILDEPTTGLDVSTQVLVLETIRSMCQLHGVAGVYISHDLAVVADVADQVAVMLQGEVVESGTIGEVLHRPQHAYTQRLLNSVPDLAGQRRIGERIAISPQDGHGADDTQGVASILQIERLQMNYGDHQVLSGVELDLRAGQTLMLLGESGSGKTTLSRCIAGLNSDYRGSIRLNGTELARSTRKRTGEQRQMIQYVFQSPFSSLNPRRTVGESVEVPMMMSGKLDKHQRRRVAEETLERVRLGSSYYHRRPGDLSGGERQRAAIARALVSTPSVMVCDEITSALDVSVQSSILDLLRDLQEETGMAMLFVTHNITLARHISHRLAVLQRGHLVDYGRTDEVLRQPEHQYTQQLLKDVVTF